METGSVEISGTKYKNAARELTDASFCPVAKWIIGPVGSAASNPETRGAKSKASAHLKN
jgi:hypothetical protein